MKFSTFAFVVCFSFYSGLALALEFQANLGLDSAYKTKVEEWSFARTTLEPQVEESFMGDSLKAKVSFLGWYNGVERLDSSQNSPVREWAFFPKDNYLSLETKEYELSLGTRVFSHGETFGWLKPDWINGRIYDDSFFMDEDLAKIGVLSAYFKVLFGQKSVELFFMPCAQVFSIPQPWGSFSFEKTQNFSTACFETTEFGMRFSDFWEQMGVEIKLMYLHHLSRVPVLSYDVAGNRYLIHQNEMDTFFLSANKAFGDWVLRGDFTYSLEFPFASESSLAVETEQTLGAHIGVDRSWGEENIFLFQTHTYYNKSFKTLLLASAHLEYSIFDPLLTELTLLRGMNNDSYWYEAALAYRIFDLWKLKTSVSHLEIKEGPFGLQSPKEWRYYAQLSYQY
ncbi:hypothetical protein GW915_03430 [bacterium]|nr:hypothetical protein [bacterium]